MSNINELNEANVGFMAQIFSIKRTPELLPVYDVLQRELQISQIYQITKRSLDICGALLGLFVLGFLLPVIALCIFCEDRGPIFYKQKRIGLHGQPFSTYKLRSMIPNADNYLEQHPTLQKAWQQSGKLREDPRITRVGRILRRTSLDELPQMLNILRGEMSLVGPRAIQPSEVIALGDLSELRQMAKPGLTGLWQVCGRSQTDYDQRCMLDCTYVMERSLEVDIHILLKTFPVVLRGVGAY